MLIRIDDGDTRQSLFTEDNGFVLVFDDGIEYNFVREGNKLVVRSAGKTNKLIVLPRAANVVELVSLKSI